MTTDHGSQIAGPHRQRILFVTGRLAAPALERVVAALARHCDFDFQIEILGISVAALMHTDWVARKLSLGKRSFDRIILPGACRGDIQALQTQWGTSVERGPRDLYDLPEYFGRARSPLPELIHYDIEILAEINHAPRLSDADIIAAAESYRLSGANVIDLGCIPGESWDRAGDVTAMLRSAGFRVSIDSFDRREVEAAVEAGAELVLSCNSSNLAWAQHLGAELVVIPDDPRRLGSLTPTLEALRAEGVRFRIDPILEPIGFGFAASLARYFEARRTWPDAEIMMGIGNVTELTEVDSAGINMLLAGLCQELRIHSVLSTEVINWARTSVAEFDRARRVVHHAVNNTTLPKHIGSQLVMLRDVKLSPRGAEDLRRLADQLTDPNFRLFVEAGEIHVMNRDGYWHGRDPFELFDTFVSECECELDASHAFYLGYEMAKAVTALTLSKQYTQDVALDWGYLTVPETSAHERRKRKRAHRGRSE